MVAVFSANAQDNGDIEFGVNLGLNVSNVSTIDSDVNAKSKISFNAGLSGEYYFSDRWGIKLKLIYDSKGWANGYIEGDNNNTITTDFKLDYITVPLMANWHFGSNRNWYLNFGPYLGILTSAKDSKLKKDHKNAFNSTDFGLAFGIGYKFDVGSNTKLFIEYDAQSGFSEIFKNNSNSSTIRNGRSSFNVGVIFNM